MLFSATPSEAAISVSHLDSAPSNLDYEHLFVSGSGWDKRHLRALRVVLYEPLPIDRLIPSDCIPTDENQSMLQITTGICSENTLTVFLL